MEEVVGRLYGVYHNEVWMEKERASAEGWEQGWERIIAAWRAHQVGGRMLSTG